MKSTKYLFLFFFVFLFTNSYSQQITTLTINVDTAGTLPSLIPLSDKFQIKNLTLKGNLNGTDILFIREMAGKDVKGNNTSGSLKILDLSGVNIVEGGDAYYYNFKSAANSLGRYAFQETILYSVTLPNSITSIGDYAFKGCNYLYFITLPNNLTSIGENAFSNCVGLNEVTFPSNLTSIGYNAFYGCNTLNNVTIPDKVLTIGNGAFSRCKGLMNIKIPSSVISIGNFVFSENDMLSKIIVSEDNLNYRSIDGVLFSKDGTKLIAYPNSKSNTYIIPNGVTTIGSMAFYSCEKLISVTIPNSVISIEEGAFSGCSLLTSLTLPASLISIGYNAFTYCSRITELYCKALIPPSAFSTTFTDYSYPNCKLYIPKGTYNDYSTAICWGEFTNIVEQVTTSISNIESSNTNVYTDNGSIIVKGGKLGDFINIYNVSGSLLHKIKITDDIVRISVAPQSIYIVKAGDKSFKIAL